ncbi:anti-H(O) lectin 1-like [Papaver somniferum]|uniref:anti-H(O) lectin 1-like n=1 Tax=Papaver somniferum TaxID=3469 RepID=UPI000E6F7935|nr:anti-H(O) lectin 1-like [Papaver somniferum]
MGFHCKSSTNSHLHSSILFFQIITILLVLPKPTNSISFNFPNFARIDRRIKFQGDSIRNGSFIDVTRNNASLYTHRDGSVGRAIYSQPIQLWDATTGRQTDFETQFSFVIDGHNETIVGDGMTFFLAPFGSALPPDSWGGALGLLTRDVSEKNLTTNQIVGVEFDSYKNEFDPSSDHVGINVNSVVSVATVALENGSIRDGRKANAWVTYNSTTKNLSVFLTYAEKPVLNRSSTLNHVVDLSKVLPEQITVGFSAATGLFFEDHKVLSWRFNSTLELIEVRKDNNKTGEGNNYQTIAPTIAPTSTQGKGNKTDEGNTDQNIPPTSSPGTGNTTSSAVGLGVGLGVLGFGLGFALFI